MKADFYGCALFLLGLLSSSGPTANLKDKHGSVTDNNVKLENSEASYKPFVVFEQGKENPYWDDNMVLKYSLELIERLNGEFGGIMNDKAEVDNGGRRLLLKYIESNRKANNEYFENLSQTIFDVCSHS